MTTRFILALLFLSISQTLFAFIPPLTSLIKEISDIRHPAPAVEAVFRHRFISGSESVEVDERLIKDRGRTYILWQTGTPPQNTIAVLEKQTYAFGKDKNITARSGVFQRYFFPQSSEDLKDQLISEQFTRRDQYLQFKQGFTPEGDPQFWGLKENYLRHDNIFLSRLPQGIAIAVVGFEEGGLRRAVFIDRALRGLYRLEWKEDPKKEGPKTFAWNFDQFSKYAPGEIYPRRASFEADGAELITSELHSWRPLNAKQLNEAKEKWRQAGKTASLSGPMEEKLRLLLSYR